MLEFVDLEEKHLELVLKWRMSPEVSQYMITDVVYSMENQRRWLERLKTDDSCRYWVIVYNKTPVGVINLAAIDRKHLHCSAGYYIGDLAFRQLGAMVPPYLYNYVFGQMKFRKIYGEVLGGNDQVLKMHRLHGFREVGTYRDHYLKNGVFLDAVLIELMSESWMKLEKYRRFTGKISK